MSRIYTRTGDGGETGLFGGGRVRKSSARVAAYGEVDELNAQQDLSDARSTSDVLWGGLGTLSYKPHPNHSHTLLQAEFERVRQHTRRATPGSPEILQVELKSALCSPRECLSKAKLLSLDSFWTL